MTRVKKDKRCLNARRVEFGQITNRTIFIQGLQNAGFLIGDRDVGAYRHPNRVVVTFQTIDLAKKARLTLKNCRLEGQNHLSKKIGRQATCQGESISHQAHAQDQGNPSNCWRCLPRRGFQGGAGERRLSVCTSNGNHNARTVSLRLQ